MAEPPVVNTSPLILLAKASRLDLLKLAGDPILVPEPVVAEIRNCREDVTADALVKTPWLRVVPVPGDLTSFRSRGLGAGEASVLLWALGHPGTEAILDDRAARRIAAGLGIPVRGTLGLVLLGKKRGILKSARPVLERLRREGMYLSDELVTDALKLVGE